MAISRQGQKWGGGNHLQQTMPRVCLLLPPPCCLYLANPTLLQHFSLLKSWLSHTSIQAGGKTKGGAYLPARQLPGAGMLSTPASHLLHLHLSASTALALRGQEHLSTGFVGGGAPGSTWWVCTSQPVLSKTAFISATAASASFLPVPLPFRDTRPARLSVP